jgi:hypothetical protein
VERAQLNFDAISVDEHRVSTDAPTRGFGRLIFPSRAVLASRGRLTAGEEKVLDILDSELAEEWELYVQPHLNGLRPDFLCLHPSGSAVVVEVKDWTFDTCRMTWRTRPRAAPVPSVVLGGKPCLQRNPIEQIYGYRSLVAQLSWPAAGPCLDVRGLLAFPFSLTGSAVAALAPAIEHRRSIDVLIAGSDLLTSIAGRPEFAPMPHGKRQDAAALIRDFLVEPDAVVVTSPLQLTRRQRELVITRTESGYRRIRGAPGSGKSVVLAARAAELSRQGSDVLVVCFNLALVSYLRKAAWSFGAIESRITFLGFHEWCQRVMVETGRYPEYKALWGKFTAHRVLNTELPCAVAQALDSDGGELASRFDAILVDEGQDYLPEWWNCLRRVRRNGGEMVLAADPGQDLFGRAESWTESAMTGAGFTGPWSDLGASVRMPSNLIGHARAFAEMFLPTSGVLLPEEPPPKLFEDSSLMWHQVAPSRFLSAAADAFVAMLDTVERRPVVHPILPGEVVLLAESNVQGKEIVSELAARGIRVSHTFSNGRSGRAARRAFSLDGDVPTATTPYSFKGWESPAIVVCITRGSSKRALAMLYSAMTRLKHVEGGSHLTVVCAEARLSRYGSTWAR